MWLCQVKDLALFGPFSIECLAFFSNFLAVFSFFTEGLAFFEKIHLTTLRWMCKKTQQSSFFQKRQRLSLVYVDIFKKQLKILWKHHRRFSVHTFRSSRIRNVADSLNALTVQQCLWTARVAYAWTTYVCCLQPSGCSRGHDQILVQRYTSCTGFTGQNISIKFTFEVCCSLQHHDAV